MTPALKSLLLFAVCNLCAANLPIGRISHVGFRVADLEKTRAYYSSLPMIEAFTQKDASGKVTLAVFKTDTDQFLEFSQGAPAGFTHLAFLTEKLEELHQLVRTLGLNPPELRTGRDRTRNFSINDPDKHRIEFVQYEPDSLQAQARAKNPGFVPRSIHDIELPVSDREAAKAFFKGKLGFVEPWPNRLQAPLVTQGYSVELMPSSAPLRLVLQEVGDEGPGTPPIHDPDGIQIIISRTSM